MTPYRPFRTQLLILAAGLPALLSACSFISTTTDTTTDAVKTTVNSVTDATGSTTKLFKSEDDKKAFIQDRFEAIRYEAAKGEGENLDALAYMVEARDRGHFARWMKRHYEDLFAGLGAPQELLGRIERYRERNG